jgi:hypothetical protein
MVCRYDQSRLTARYGYHVVSKDRSRGLDE